MEYVRKDSKRQIADTQMPHHESRVVKIPGVGSQAPADRVHDGVFDNVHTARHPGGEEPFCPARQSIGLHQEASRE